MEFQERTRGWCIARNLTIPTSTNIAVPNSPCRQVIVLHTHIHHTHTCTFYHSPHTLSFCHCPSPPLLRLRLTGSKKSERCQISGSREEKERPWTRFTVSSTRLCACSIFSCCPRQHEITKRTLSLPHIMLLQQTSSSQSYHIHIHRYPASRGKNYVEEEKRILRQSGM